MNRIDRLAAIVIQLQSRRVVKARDIADKFSISLRTVYRDVHALQDAGVPVIGEAGTGYQLMEGYRLPPVMFSQDEASALLTAGKLVQSKTDAGISKHYASALDKIKAVLRGSEKDHIQELDEHVAVINHPTFMYQRPDELYLQSLLKAISANSVIQIRYISIERNEPTNRSVEPIGIYNMGSHWYLVAWCRLRNDYRNFRTDKIEKLVITGEPISKTHPPLQAFINKTSSEKDVKEVIIDIEPGVVKYLGEQKYYSGYVKEENAGEYIRMTFLTSSLMGFARWFMLFGDHAKIVTPAKLTEMIADIAASILKKIEQSNMLLT